jgi:voltage-gated potassium channel
MSSSLKAFAMILFNQVAAAVLLLSLTLCLQCAGVAALIEWLKGVLTRDTHNFRPIHAAALVVKSSVAVIVLHGFVILLWAGWYRLHCFPSWELAFYFSASTYTTVGCADVMLPSNWRLLGPLESMTGVLMCGISVAVLFAIVTRSIAIHERRRKTSTQKTPELSSINYIKSAATHSREHSHG